MGSPTSSCFIISYCYVANESNNNQIQNTNPILFISGASSDMNDWDASTLGNLSSNHTVIVFDIRGVGNTTIGSKPYTIQQLANDTAGLLDALNIQKADVLGLSLGSYLAQQLTIMYPDKVNSLVLVRFIMWRKRSYT